MTLQAAQLSCLSHIFYLYYVHAFVYSAVHIRVGLSGTISPPTVQGKEKWALTAAIFIVELRNPYKGHKITGKLFDLSCSVHLVSTACLSILGEGSLFFLKYLSFSPV